MSRSYKNKSNYYKHAEREYTIEKKYRKDERTKEHTEALNPEYGLDSGDLHTFSRRH